MNENNKHINTERQNKQKTNIGSSEQYTVSFHPHLSSGSELVKYECLKQNTNKVE